MPSPNQCVIMKLGQFSRQFITSHISFFMVVMSNFNVIFYTAYNLTILFLLSKIILLL